MQVCVSPGVAYLDGAWKSTLNTCLRLSSVTCMRHPRQSGPSGMNGTVCLTIRMAWRWGSQPVRKLDPFAIEYLVVFVRQKIKIEAHW